MKPITFTTSILSVSVLGAALLALGSIGFSSTPGEMSKITYTGNLWCVSNLVQETDASGSLVYGDTGIAKNDPRLKGRENLIRREQVTGETQEEVETKATKTGLWEKSNKDELRAALDKNNAEGDGFYTHHFNQGATHPGPCVGSGTGQQEGLWINDAINQECFGSGSDCGFDTGKLSLYSTGGGDDPGSKYAETEAAKQYAINTLKVDPAAIKQYTKTEVENMIRAEIAKQFGALSNKFGTTQADAQQAILSYQLHESAAYQLFDSSGHPSYTHDTSGDALNILSLTNDKFTGSKNRRIAASYDVKYAIYMGVKEHIDTFKGSGVSGTGKDRWRKTLGHVFWPSDPEKYWTDKRGSQAESAWTAYSHETVYQCPQKPTSTSTTGSTSYKVVKTMDINITWFSPNLKGNTCDSKTGGGAGVAGGGMYAMLNGRAVWTDGKGNVENYVFAEPTTNNVIPWDQRNQLAVVIPGFNNNKPIMVRDHYQSGNHAGQNYLDLMATCSERNSVPTGLKTVQIVDLTKPTSSTSNTNTTSPANTSTLATGASPNCPASALKSGPSEGEDYQMQIAHQINLINNARNEALAITEGGADKKSEKILVDTAMKYAPGADGKTRYKYSLGSHGPKIFDCSGFVSWVLTEAKKAGAKVVTSEFRLSGGYAGVGTLIHKIDMGKFTDPQGRSILRKAADMPDLNLLRPGDLLFFGTSTQCSDPTHKKCPNIIGHIGIYIGDGKYINSTSSDQDLSKDSASNDNPNVVPPITAHSQGEKYDDYNGVKIFDLQNSYFTDFYIETRRIIPASTSTMGTVEGLGSTTLPAGPNVRPSLNSVHGLSAGHSANKKGHGCYQYSHPGAADGDALDFSGTYGYAVFSGTASHHDAGRDSYTVVTSTNGRVKAYYYHTFNLKDGPVTAGEKIVRTGQAGIDHVHFEMKVDGKPVNGDPAYKGDDIHYVRSLYINMKKVLGLI